MRTVLISLAVGIAALAVIGCADDSDGASGGKVRVVATTTQLGDIAKQVGGSRVLVDTILDSNVDPHDYEPRPSDAQAIAEADVVLASGGEVDEWLGDLVDQAGGDAKRVTVKDEIGVTGDDPHWWQDPRNAIKAVGNAPRAAVYRSEITRTDAAIERCIASIPAENRKLVTNHDAFGFFAQRYHIEILGSIIPSRTTAAQPSAGDIRKLVDAIRREGVKTIFPESALNRRVEDAVARDAGAKVGEALFADTVGPAGTYLGALRHDASAIADGLGGSCDI
jgi:ABC-type Zn uptake system ZnuABC Zn-binding protein ZnuA